MNMLRPWNTPDAQVLKVVVAEEDEDEHTTGPGPSESNLDMEQKAELDTLLNSFSDVINNTPGRASLVEHVIKTSNSPPLRTAPYRLASAWKDQLQAEIHDLLAAGIIRPSLSPWSSPIIPVRKKDGSVRLCVDFRRINAVSVPDPYLMPRVDEIIDRLGKAQYLSKLDLNKGFHQVPVNPSDIEKTAFCVFMPFSLRNAPATFQRLMDQVLVNMMDFARAYIDDVVVYSESWEEHLRHLQTVLERFWEVGLTAKPSKCEWVAASGTYLLGPCCGKRPGQTGGMQGESSEGLCSTYHQDRYQIISGADYLLSEFCGPLCRQFSGTDCGYQEDRTNNCGVDTANGG